MHLLFVVAVQVVGISALIAVRAGRGCMTGTVSMFFIAVTFIVGFATITATLAADPSWLLHAGLLSVMCVGGVIDFSTDRRAASVV